MKNKSSSLNKVLIAGANGFLGRHICSETLKRGLKPDALVHSSSENVPTGVGIYSTCSIEDLWEKNYETIFIVAGNYRDSIDDLIESNIELPKKLIRMFPSSRFVFVSSVAVYGFNSSTIHLESEYRAPSVYGMAKLAGEFVMQTAKHASILRLSNVYGVDMYPKLLLPTVISQAKNDRRIILFGDGTRKQDYLYIQDAVDVCMSAANSDKPGIFIGAYGSSISNNELANIISKIIPDTEIVHEGSDNAQSSFYDISHTTEKLGFTPQFSPNEGIAEVIKHMNQ